MSKPDAWMPLYIGDYLADTAGLTAEQHGAYLLLIMAYWRSGAALPDDDGRLARIACMTPAQWKRNRSTIAAFFVLDAGAWHHKRISEELAAASVKSAKAQASAHARWHSGRNANASADAVHSECSSPSPSQSQLDDGDEASARDPKREVLEAIGVWDDARWLGNGGLVEAWMAAGCDLDRDILPTVKAVMAKRGKQDPPTSLKYFDRAVMDAYATRTTPARPGKANGTHRPGNGQSNRDRLRAGIATAFPDVVTAGAGADGPARADGQAGADLDDLEAAR